MERRTSERQIKYSPLPSQKKFHGSKAKIKGFSGPIGSGKSQALCQEAIRLSYLNPGRTGLIGAPTYPMLRDSTLTSFLEVLQESAIPYELNKGDNTLLMKDSGSRILLRSLDEFERLRGTNLAWFGVDELTYTQEEAWLRLEGRLRDPKATVRCGFAVWTPKGFDWVYRKFIQDPPEGYETIRAQAFENRHLTSQVPDFYERLKSSYNEQFYRQEVLGDYLNLQGGMVYSSFDRRLHVKEVTLNPNLPVLWALDFNVDPMCSVVVQIASNGEIQVLDEIVLRRATTPMACDAFAERLGRIPGAVRVYGDASGAAMQTTGSSDHQVLREFFRREGANVEFRMPRANPPVRERVALVNTKLRNAYDEIRLVVHPKCKELIADFEQVGYVEDTMQIDKNRDRMRTHVSDALGYLICQECGPKTGPVSGGRLI